MAADEVGLAHKIGAGIAKGTGSIPQLKFKDNKPKSAPKKSKAVKGELVEEPAVEKPKPEPEIVDAEIVSERPFRQPYTPKKELTGGPRWESFKSYVEKTKDSPAVDLRDIENRITDLPKPPRRRDATFKDTVEAIKGGHISRLDAIQISPKYAQKYASKVEDNLFAEDEPKAKKKAPSKKKKK